LEADMSDTNRNEEDLTTPEEQAAQEKLDKKREETNRTIAALLEQGWNWSETEKNLLVHPQDKELNAWHDPYSHELLLSPELVKSLKQALP
jgi:hypothetical protein